MKEKSLKEISWNVSEDEYREDSALSYSTLATYERGGFNCLNSLFDKKDSPSLTFGSAVDAIITGGQEEFDSRFIVAEFPVMSDKAVKIIKSLFDENHIVCRGVSDIPEHKVLDMIEKYEYWDNCKTETKLKKFYAEGVAEYYDLLQLAEGKTILSSEMYSDVVSCVDALKESEATRAYFATDNPFDDSVEHLYQLKFKATLNGIDYRCMSDLLVVDYEHKIIYPVDLKTSSHPEWEFYKSFIQWNYQIQARLYWRIIRDNLDRDPYFKDFVLANYRFIVVNKATRRPLVWFFAQTTSTGTIALGANKTVKFRDPEDIGAELHKYLVTNPIVPEGVDIIGDNNIVEWINKEYE